MSLLRMNFYTSADRVPNNFAILLSHAYAVFLTIPMWYFNQNLDDKPDLFQVGQKWTLVVPYFALKCSVFKGMPKT